MPTENPYTSPTSVQQPAPQRGLAATLLRSLAWMLPWPLLGIGLARTLLDTPHEIIMPFGGITVLLMLPILAGIGSGFPAIILSAIVLAAWSVVLIVPAMGVHWRGWNPKGMLIFQSSISFTQAVIGTIWLFGKMV